MRKLKVTEMGRLSLAEYKASEKQPAVKASWQPEAAAGLQGGAGRSFPPGEVP